MTRCAPDVSITYAYDDMIHPEEHVAEMISMKLDVIFSS